MLVEARIRLKSEVLDPQGEAIRRVMAGLGYQGIEQVRVGKLMLIEVAGDDPEAAREQVEAACRELLANPVIEDYEVRVP